MIAQKLLIATYGTFSPNPAPISPLPTHLTQSKRPEWTDLIDRIIISNLLKPKISIEPNDPPRQSIQHLRQRGMNVKVVLSPDILACERAEMHLVKDDLVGMANPKEADDEGEDGEESGHTPRGKDLLTMTSFIWSGPGCGTLFRL